MSDIRTIAVAVMYAFVAFIFGTFQLIYNRIMGRNDPHYAEAWFVGVFWFPLLLWVLAGRIVHALLPRKAKRAAP